MLNEKSKLHTETYNVIIFMNIHKTTQNILLNTLTHIKKTDLVRCDCGQRAENKEIIP